MNSLLPNPLAGMFFDLDGTLVDSAPDLHDALVALCREREIMAPKYETVRAATSRGARAIVSTAFGDQGEDVVDAVMPRFLELYVDTGTVRTHPFPGVETLLRKLESRRIAWGVITNKAGFLTAPLLERLGYAGRVAAVVAGDTLPVRKPDPQTVLHACRQAGLDPAHCAFVGDDPRDVQAGRGAGACAVVAGWGYLDPQDARGWGAEAYAETAEQIADWLD
ncbi:MAG TPA: HAD-IA family hydrolase [Rhodanobacteraceae bacterium]|nr:HAD-IA family hydrolase [Rhodanobacteraceae bacterium]